MADYRSYQVDPWGGGSGLMQGYNAMSNIMSQRMDQERLDEMRRQTDLDEKYRQQELEYRKTQEENRSKEQILSDKLRLVKLLQDSEKGAQDAMKEFVKDIKYVSNKGEYVKFTGHLMTQFVANTMDENENLRTANLGMAYMQLMEFPHPDQIDTPEGKKWLKDMKGWMDLSEEERLQQAIDKEKALEKVERDSAKETRKEIAAEEKANRPDELKWKEDILRMEESVKAEFKNTKGEMSDFDKEMFKIALGTSSTDDITDQMISMMAGLNMVPVGKTRLSKDDLDALSQTARDYLQEKYKAFSPGAGSELARGMMDNQSATPAPVTQQPRQQFMSQLPADITQNPTGQTPVAPVGPQSPQNVESYNNKLRQKYNELLDRGMEENQAWEEAQKYARGY